ncbi:hypothetical protein ACFOU2_07630 [Bacillus songklensis]|uniref:Glucokinase n=1 Tax=Bacillus songklensis TaxID=1069116 RepID=A0ABV8B195_9BACI
MNEKNIWIGVDLGGTNIRVAAVEDNGTIVQEIQQLTDAEKGSTTVPHLYRNK